MHARLLHFAGPIDGDPNPARLPTREQLQRQAVGERRSHQQAVAAVRIHGDVLRLLPQGVAAFALAIDRHGDALDRRDRQIVGGTEDAAEPHQPGHRREGGGREWRLLRVQPRDGRDPHDRDETALIRDSRMRIASLLDWNTVLLDRWNRTASSCGNRGGRCCSVLHRTVTTGE